MENLIFTPKGWEDYLYWQAKDKKTLKRINNLIIDIARDPFHGIGKPEPLKNNRSGWWSRRIDETNRIIYKLEGNGNLVISQCRSHYDD